MNTSKIVAVETSAVDINYSLKDIELGKRFIKFIKEKTTKKEEHSEEQEEKGGCLVVMQEAFEDIVLDFATQENFKHSGITKSEKVASILEQVLGASEMQAGGALANTVHLLVNSKIGGKKLFPDTQLYCTVGNDAAGEVFQNSLAGHLSITEPKGSTMVVHVIPINGERFMIPTPSIDSCDKNFDATLEQIKNMDFSGIGMFMLGGYTLHSGKYKNVTDILVEKLQEAPIDKRPSIVLTAAAPHIAESSELKDALNRIKGLAKLIVFGDADELRKLCGQDTEWRKELPKNSKPTDEIYKTLQSIANKKTLNWAQQIYCKNTDVTFVVTNGEQGAHVLSSNGVSDAYIPPKPASTIVSVVGAGDVFAAGYITGELSKLTEAQKVQLGFIAASHVICRSEARLEVRDNGDFTGLLAYLDVTGTTKELLERLVSNTQQKEQSLKR